MTQTFASFWFGGALSPHSQLCVQSFLDHGHQFRIYSYDANLAVPDGCHVADASQIYNSDKVFFYKGAGEKVSAFSNMFRYRMIFETGICWVDTDVLCTSSTFPHSEYLFARQDDEYFNGAVLRFPRGHEAMRLAAEYCWDVRKTAKWGDLGPRLLTQIVNEYRMESLAVDKQLIYPLHWKEAMLVLDPGKGQQVSQRVTGAVAVHLWNEIFTRNGVDKRALPPEGSYLAQAVERHRSGKYFSK